MIVAELIDVLSKLPADSTVLIVDPHHDYEAEPNGVYSDFQERLDNEGTFDVKMAQQEGVPLVEIGSVLSQI